MGFDVYISYFMIFHECKKIKICDHFRTFPTHPAAIEIIQFLIIQQFILMSTPSLKPKEMIFLTHYMRADIGSHNNRGRS